MGGLVVTAATAWEGWLIEGGIRSRFGNPASSVANKAPEGWTLAGEYANQASGESARRPEFCAAASWDALAGGARYYPFKHNSSGNNRYRWLPRIV
jgi:hypothetical protein